MFDGLLLRLFFIVVRVRIRHQAEHVAYTAAQASDHAFVARQHALQAIGMAVDKYDEVYSNLKVTPTLLI